MSPLDDDRWRAVSPYLDQALELEGEARAAFLVRLRAEHPDLAADVEALLEERRALSREGFLEHDAPSLLGRGALAGQTLGAYTLLSLVGQGGMGSVWLAERSDGRFTGQVAIKLLNPASIGRAGEERFKLEGRVLARLRHPHIAQMLDAGVTAGGQPYLVLEHVEGTHIDAYCDARRASIDERLRLFLDMLGAVAHAHANLIVHRDIKPSNVLVTTDGQVKLLDFGIAKLLEPEAGGDATKTAERAMTPDYAAPEQLQGGDVTTATDVYALGVLLYVLLSGRHPAGRNRSSAAELVKAVVDLPAPRLSVAAVTEEPADGSTEEIAARRATDARRLRRTLRGDLENIVARALKKEPAERYASAEAMADDLRRYLEHLPVRARPDSFGYRARKFILRNRVAISAAAIVVLALVTGTALAVWQGRVAARERDQAIVRLQRAEATNDLTSFLLAEATPKAGKPITNADLLAKGADLIERRFAGDPELRVHMLLTLADRYEDNQQFDRAKETFGRAYELSRPIHDRGLRALAACAIADTLSEQGDPAKADALLAEALTSVAAEPEAALDEARCRVYDSIVSLRKGDIARALASAQRAVALDAKNRTTEGRELELDASLALANALGQGPRFSSSDEEYRKLVALLDAQGRGDSRRAAVALNNWSAMLQNAGQHLKAIPVSERAVRLAREQDSVSGASASQLVTYASALTIAGRAAEALPIEDEAVTKAKAAGSPQRLFTTLGAAANAYREAGDFDRAARILDEADALLKATPTLPKHYPGLLDRHRARLALSRGDPTSAETLARSALSRFEEAKRPPGDLLPVMLVLAEAQNGNGHPDAALQTAQRALAISSERLGDMKHSYNIGQAHLEIGVAQARLKNVAAARDELRQAVEHLQACVGPDASPSRRAVAELSGLGS